MTTQATILRVLVSSPSDVQPERDALGPVVEELNLSLSEATGIRLELVRWETHSVPELGPDPQEVLNQQLGDDYDIFLGILWHRFGTPTPRAGSGTEEEFQRAYNRYQADPSTCSIMFYFNDEPVAPAKIDAQQLAAVQKFRAILQTKGILGSFGSLDDFLRLVRVHLTRQVFGWGRHGSKSPSPPSIPTLAPVVPPASKNLEDEGFLDLVERGTSSFGILAEIGQRLAHEMKELTANVEAYAQELTALDLAHHPERIGDAKRVINGAAQRMEYFADQLQANLQPFRNASHEGFESMGKAAQIVLEFGQDRSNEIRGNLAALGDIKPVLARTAESIAAFRDTVVTLPRATTRLNQAKRRTGQILDALEQEVRSALSLAEETEKLLEDILRH